MTSRAEAAEETGRRIVAAVQALIVERPYGEVTLEAVAARAGVTLQTVLRRFGSKADLVAAAAKEGAARVEAQRGAAVPGDLPGCVTNLFDHYEEWGETSLRLLAQEETVEAIAALVEQGRATHAAWVERVFASEIREARRTRSTKIRRAQLITICDVYTWKLLRRDLGLERAEAERAMLGMLEAICRGRSS